MQWVSLFLLPSLTFSISPSKAKITQPLLQTAQFLTTIHSFMYFFFINEQFYQENLSTLITVRNIFLPCLVQCHMELDSMLHPYITAYSNGRTSYICTSTMHVLQLILQLYVTKLILFVCVVLSLYINQVTDMYIKWMQQGMFLQCVLKKS